MKRAASFVALLLLSALPGFGSSNLHGVTSQNQFHFEPKGKNAAKANSRNANMGPHRLNRSATFPFDPKVLSSQPKTVNKQSRTNRNASNTPSAKIGFVSATQIPAGGVIGNYGMCCGGSYTPAFSGDFNGDGKQDLAIVTSIAGIYSISVSLGNGDGTFQAPVLATVPGNDSNAQIVVGDLNGDGKSDILVLHQVGDPNSTSGSYSTSGFDVMISNSDGTFTLGNDFSITSANLSGGVLADVNGDGILDVVAVDQNNPANVITLLGSSAAPGTFQAPTSITLSGEAGTYTALVDLNHDGLLDIADIDYNTHQLTTYLATAGGATGVTSYGGSTSYTTPDGLYDACSLSAGDLNGDGYPEIVTPNCMNTDDNITVYVNNHDGTFGNATSGGLYYGAAFSETSTSYADVNPMAVTIADVNGDGKADIVSTNSYSGDVTILLGNGDGTVQLPTVGYAVGGYPTTPAIVADFNGDGLVDIIVPDGEFNLDFLKGYGDGTFRSTLNYYAPVGEGNFSDGSVLASGDFNGDGIPDFVAGSFCCDSNTGITVFLSRPDGSMQAGINYGSGGSLNFVAVGDFNKDGKLDIAAVDSNSNSVQIFPGNGDGTFTVGSTFITDISPNNYPEDLVAGDFNNDGYPDLAVMNTNNSDVGILLNDSTNPGSFLTPGIVSLSSTNYQGLAAGDLNGDGNIDLAVPVGSAVAVFLGNGDGTFGAEYDVAIAGNPSSVAIGDFNGDGIPDLATASTGGISIALGIGNGATAIGTGTFQPAVSYSTTLQSLGLANTGYVKAVDIDGDGTLDLVYTNESFGTVGILFGAGDGTFGQPVESPSASYALGIAVADLNQDGAPDVVTAGVDFAGVNVLLNANGSGTLANYTVTVPQPASTVAAGASATYTFTVAPSNHYNGTVTFACGALPALTTCTFSPASIAMASGTTTVTLTISTTATTTTGMLSPAATPHGGTSLLLASLSTMGLFGIVVAGASKKRSRWTMVVLGMLILVMMFSLVACGGSSSTSTGGGVQTNAGTPAGTYTVPVTATGTTGTNGGNTSAHTVNVTLTVQ